MKKTLSVLTMAVALVLSAVGMAAAEVNAVTPSTNDINRDNGWAHFNVVEDDVPGQVTVEFVNPRAHFSCFEYRSDGEAPDSTDPNYNELVTDGLWDFVCVNNSTTDTELTILADSQVEIRMVFGAEEDERFDWTSIDVLEVPKTKEDCKDGGWETFGDYKNQGQCVSEYARS